MISTGIDLLEISRMKKALQNPRFLQRVFGKAEITELEKSAMQAQKAAGAFAAKEAFGKALGVGISGFSLRDVEILHDTSGKPYFSISGNAQYLAEKNSWHFSLSITHTKQYAVAVVIAYNEEQGGSLFENT